MREILFRGQTRRYGEKVYIPSGEKVPSNWAYGGIFPSHNGSMAIIYQQEPTIEKFPVHADTVGQYTGLKDKNGVRIFEGDILRCVSEYCDKTYITEVWADGNTLCVDIEGYDFDYTAIDFAIEYWRNDRYEIEVIGNIYDNPELLGVKT